MKEETSVYFIDNRAGAIKIGLARDPANRLAQLNCAAGTEPGLALLGAVVYPRRAEAQEVETYLHRMFSSLVVRGEWFEAKPALRAFIASALADGIRIPITPEKVSRGDMDLGPPISIRFDPPSFEDLRRLAKEERRKFGDMVRVLVDEARDARSRRKPTNREAAA